MDEMAGKSNEDKSEDERSTTSTTTRSLRVKTDSATTTGRPSPRSSTSEKNETGKTSLNRNGKLARPDPDLVVDWADLEVTFRVINKKGVNPEVSYQLFPPPENPSALPCFENSINRHNSSDSLPRLKNGATSTSASTELNGKTGPSTAGSTKSSGKSGKLKCHFCDRSFTKSSYLKSHLQSHPNSKPYKCEICGWGFFQQDNLIRHMASHTQGGEGFKCSHCVASFNSRSVLVIHMKDAHGEKTAIVSGPGTKTSISSNSPLSVTGIVKNSPINIAKLGPPPPLVPIKASPLKVTLPAPASVRPTTPAPVQSPTAGVPKAVSKLPTAAQVMSGMKVSPQLSSGGIKVSGGPSPLLAGRRMVQVGGTPVQSSSPGGCRCQICGKLFLTPSNLKQHMNMHKIQNKPFRCSFCDARFNQESNLQKHVASAHSSTGHQCPHCSIKFRTQQDVQDHVSVMHPLALATANGFLGHGTDDQLDEEMEGDEEESSAKQFACTICFKSFDQVNQLNAHVREHSLKKTSLDLKPISLLRPPLNIKLEEHLDS